MQEFTYIRNHKIETFPFFCSSISGPWLVQRRSWSIHLFVRRNENGLETKISRKFLDFLHLGHEFSSFQAMEPKNEPS